jgi:hypothetical protein
MPITVQCTGCPARLNAPDTAVGKKVKCPKCQALVPVPSPFPAAKPAPPPPPEPEPLIVEDRPPPPQFKKSGVAPRPAAKPAAPPPEPLGLDDDEPAPPPAKKSGIVGKPAARKRDEEGERKKPARKKRGAKKAVGGPPVALVLSIAGFIGLAIVGFVAYSASSTDDGKGGGGGGKAAVPNGWKLVTANKGGFKAYFPTDSKEDDVSPPELPPADKKKKAEPLPYTAGMVMVALPDESKMAMAIGFKFRPNVSAAERDKAVSGFTDTFTKDPAGAGVKVLSQKEVTWLGQKGKEMLIESPATEGKAQVVLRQVTVGSNVYIGMVGAKGGRPTPEDENGFFDNFEIIK